MYDFNGLFGYKIFLSSTIHNLFSNTKSSVDLYVQVQVLIHSYFRLDKNLIPLKSINLK